MIPILDLEESIEESKMDEKVDDGLGKKRRVSSSSPIPLYLSSSKSST